MRDVKRRAEMCRARAACVAAILAIGVPSSAADVVLARSTRHLSLRAALAPDAIAPGGRLSLVVNVIPKPRMHVYAPGTKYRAVSVTLDKHPALKPSKLVYPSPSIYFFKPLKETVLVYSSPFKLTMNIAVGTIPSATRRLAISGTLAYQACDDGVCYKPESIPLAWNLPVSR